MRGKPLKNRRKQRDSAELALLNGAGRGGGRAEDSILWRKRRHEVRGTGFAVRVAAKNREKESQRQKIHHQE